MRISLNTQIFSVPAVLGAVDLPAEAIAIQLPIDRLMDAFCNRVNVEEDMVGSLVVQKWVGIE